VEPITQSEYFSEVNAIAENIVRECEGDEDACTDRVHEDVDGHRWIIYTYYNLQVLTHSSHEDAYFEDFGALSADSFSDAVQKMAFAAMHSDVQDAIGPALETYRENVREGKS
jgi:hypothetical protein